MDEKALARKLHGEGFGTTYVWQDGSGAYYPTTLTRPTLRT